MKKRFLVLATLFAVFTSGCENKGARGGQWIERHIPTTDAERIAVREMTEKLLSEVPTSLSGFDQDWDDAIRAAGDVAMRTCCQVTWWEWKPFPGSFTGRWRYGDQVVESAYLSAINERHNR